MILNPGSRVWHGRVSAAPTLAGSEEQRWRTRIAFHHHVDQVGKRRLFFLYVIHDDCALGQRSSCHRTTTFERSGGDAWRARM
jgi:hypothetical protein